MTSSKITKNIEHACSALSDALKNVISDVLGEKHAKYVDKIIAAIKTDNFQESMTEILTNVTKNTHSKKLKDPLAPKGKKSSYIIFCTENRQRIKDSNSEINAKEILKALATEWNGLSDKKREKYKKKADDDAERYALEMSNYQPSEEFLAKQVAKGGSSKKKNKKERKEGPKKACSAYIFFCTSNRSAIKTENPDMKGKDITSELGTRWNNLTNEEKEPYQNQANDDKIRYTKEKEAWDLEHPDSSKKKDKSKSKKVDKKEKKEKKKDEKSDNEEEV